MAETYGTYKFNEIFPKTFSYLEIVVPLRQPKFVNKKIPNPTVIFKDKKYPDSHKSAYLNTRAEFSIIKGAIIIYLHTFLEQYTYFTQKIQRFDFNNLKDLLKICKYIDSLPKLKIIIIHEYEHVIQHKLGRLFNVKEIIQLHIKSYAYIFFHFISNKYRIRFSFKIYELQRTEIEARMAEWIYFRLTRRRMSMSMVEYILKRDIGRIKRDYKSVLEALEHKKEYTRSQRKALIMKKYRFEILLETYPKIVQESEREIVNLRAKLTDI